MDTLNQEKGMPTKPLFTASHEVRHHGMEDYEAEVLPHLEALVA